jgi:hypothetical protein
VDPVAPRLTNTVTPQVAEGATVRRWTRVWVEIVVMASTEWRMASVAADSVPAAVLRRSHQRAV